MANSALIPFGSVHEQQQWSDQLLHEYLNLNVFRPFMRFGMLTDNAMTGDNDPQSGVIAVVDYLGAKQGTKINIPLRRALRNAGVTDDQVLEGQEEEMVFDNESLSISLIRHATIIRNRVMSEQRAAFDIFNEARPSLQDWLEEKMRSDIITAMTDVTRGRVQARYLYGASESNWNATHATALGNVDSTNDKLTVKAIKKMKDKAKAGDTANGVGKVRPARFEMSSGATKKQYVLFVGTRLRRHLEEDAQFQNMQFRNQTNGEAYAPRFVDTSSFVGMVDGVFVYEIEEFPVYSGVGASTIDVGHAILSGAQSVVVCYGQRPAFAQKEFDYGAQIGVAVSELRGVSKLVYNSADYGLVNGFFAANEI